MSYPSPGETSTNSGSSPELRLIGAAFCLFLSLVGAGLGAYLTVLKFKMSYTPCLTDEGSCKIGEMSCNDALSSSWSLLLGLPLSLWGTALYVVTALLSAVVFWRRGLAVGAVPDLLLACAVWAVFVTLVLGVYTLVALESACPFCLTLYGVSVLLLVGAQLAHGGHGLVRPRAWFAELRRNLPGLADAGFYAAMALVCATGLQSMMYHGTRRLADSQAGCPEPTRDLPAPSIRAGAPNPSVIIAMFLDMTCPMCLKEFKLLGNALQGEKFPEPVQLWVYHTPRQACDPSAFPAGNARSDDNARNDNACLAARAAECMEKLRPGDGFVFVGGLFALHESREADVPLFTAERIAEKAVDFELEIDPDDLDNALFRCINDDGEILQRITEHQKYAEDFEVPTVAVFRAKDGGVEVGDKPLLADGNTPLAGLFSYVSAKAHVDP